MKPSIVFGDTDENLTRTDRVYKITIYCMWVNIALTVLKLVTGLLGNSRALVADAIHSASDFATDIAVLVGFYFVKKPVDDCHDYGHGKYETLTGAFVGGALVVVGAYIGYNAINGIILYLDDPNKLSPPTLPVLFVAFTSIVVKEYLYRITAKVGKKIKSDAVLANALHHRSDALSSIAVLFGVSCAHFLGAKWRVLDPIAAIGVAVFIVKVGWQISYAAVRELLEASLPPDVEKEIIDTINAVPGASGGHFLRTRKIGSNYAIDAHINVDPTLTIEQAHAIADNVENVLLEKYGKETAINIHVEPAGGKD